MKDGINQKEIKKLTFGIPHKLFPLKQSCANFIFHMHPSKGKMDVELSQINFFVVQNKLQKSNVMKRNYTLIVHTHNFKQLST